MRVYCYYIIIKIIFLVNYLHISENCRTFAADLTNKHYKQLKINYYESLRFKLSLRPDR